MYVLFIIIMYYGYINNAKKMSLQKQSGINYLEVQCFILKLFLLFPEKFISLKFSKNLCIILWRNGIVEDLEQNAF